jgi:predicted XRE-type DNA-binding protein
MDPFEMQNRFSNEHHKFFRLQESPFKLEDYEEFIRRLPQREQDLIEMYCRNRKKQKEIAAFFGVTQGAVSHRLTRAIQRLKYLRDMPKLTQDLRGLLKEHFTPFDIDVVETMIETTCQSKTAAILNKKHRLRGDKQMTQVKVRHRFERAVAKLEQLMSDYPDLDIVHKLATYVKNNLYMMHEVILPHFNRGKRVRYSEVL